MITRAQVDELEKLTGQLDKLHIELSALSKKSPNDAVNKFKLKFVNTILTECNSLLGKNYKPFAEFDIFNPDDVPSNSDVTFIASQYMSALEKFRSDSIKMAHGSWQYDMKDNDGTIRTAPPAKLKKS